MFLLLTFFFLLGYSPFYAFIYFYCILTFFAIGVRLIQFIEMNHFLYFFEFCYFANYLSIIFFFCFANNKYVWFAVWTSDCGVIALAMVFLNNKMVIVNKTRHLQVLIQ